MATDADIPDPISQMKREVEDKELTCGELSGVTVNEDTLEEKKVESWLSQPPETIQGLGKTENLQVSNYIEDADVTIIDKGIVVPIEGKQFLQSTSVSEGKPKNNLEENQLNNEEEFCGSLHEEGCMITDKETIAEANSVQNAGVKIQTTDLAEGSSMDVEKLGEICNKEENMDNVISNTTTVVEQDIKETDFKGEDENSKTSSSSLGTEMDHQIIQPSKDTEDKKDKGGEILCTSVKDVCEETACLDNQKTEEATESIEAAKDKLDETISAEVCLDAEGSPENSGLAFEGSQETIELSERMKDTTSTSTENQNQNSQSSHIKEASETGLKDIVKKSPNGADNQPETIATCNNNLRTTDDGDENSGPKADVSSREPEESVRRESKDLTQTEALTVECKHEGAMAVAGEGNTLAEEHHQIETPKHGEHPEQSFTQKADLTKENLESALDVASEEIETTAFNNECAEKITNIGEQRPVGNPEEVLEETRKVKTIISDDINNMEIPEEKNLLTVDLDETNTSTEVEIPNKNGNDLVSHPNVEESATEGGEKHKEVSISELGDQVHRAFEVPKEEEKNVNEMYEASKSPECNILKDTFTGAVNSSEFEKECELKSDEELKEINMAENIKEERAQKEKAADELLQIATKSDENEKSTFEEDTSVTNSPPFCPGEEADHYDQEDKSRPNSSEKAATVSECGDQSCRTSDDQIINKQEYEDPKVANRGEDREQETKNEEHTITDHSLESTWEDTTVCSQENEMKTNYEVEMGKELETTGEGEIIKKQVLAEENRVEDVSMVSAGEKLEAESSQEDPMMTKMPKQEVVEALQTDDESAIVGIQIAEEDSTADEHSEACAGEETKYERSHEEEKEEKEPDTVVLETTHRGQDTAEHIVNKSVSIQSAESCEERAVQESSQEDEANELYDNTRTSMTMEESAITDLPCSSAGEKIVEESLKADNRDTLRSEEEVSNSNTECIDRSFDATYSLEDKEARALETESEPNQGKTAFSVAETSEKEITEKVLEKADSKVPVAAEDTSLTEAESENTMQEDSHNLVSEEGGLETTATSGNGSNDIHIIAKTTESSNLGENEDMEIPKARKHGADDTVDKTEPEDENEFHCTLSKTEDKTETATAETCLDAIIEQDLQASSTLSLEDHKLVTAEVSEITGEAQEKDKGSYAREETPSESINQGPEVASNDEIIAPALVTEATSLGEVHQNVDSVKALDTSSEAKSLETAKTTDTGQQEGEVDSMRLEETSSMVSHLPTHEHQKADIVSIDEEKSDAIDVEVEEKKIPDAVSESKVQGAEQIHETDTSLTVGNTDTNEIEEQIRDVPKAMFETTDRGVKSASKDEIAPCQILQAEEIEEELRTSSSAVLSSEEDGETTTTTEKPEDGCKKKDDTEVNTTEIEERIRDASEEFSESINQGVEAASNEEIAPGPTVQADKIEEQLQITSSTMLSTEEDDGETTNTIAKLEDGCKKKDDAKFDKTKIDASIREASKELSETTNQDVEAASNDEIAPGPTLQAEKIEEQLLLLSPVMISHEEAGETKTALEKAEDACTTRDDTEVDTDKIQEQIRNASKALSDPINQGVEAASNDEVAPGPTLQAETIEEKLQVSSSAAPSKGEDGETTTTTAKTEDGRQKKDDTTVDTNGIEEQIGDASEALSEPISIEASSNDETPHCLNLKAEKIEEQLQMSSNALPSNDEDGETTTLIEKTKEKDDTKVDSNEVEEQVTDAPKALSNPINQSVEAASNDDIAPGQTLQAEEIEEQLQVSSSTLLSNDDDGETTTTIEMTEECTKKDDTEIDNLQLEENPGAVSQPVRTTCERVSNAIGKKYDADVVNVEETKTLDAMPEHKDQGFEEIYENKKSQAAENTDTDKTNEEIKATENTSHQGVEAVADGQSPDQPVPVGKFEEHLQVSSTSSASKQDCEIGTTIEKIEDESTKNVEAEVDNIRFEEATAKLSMFPTTEHEDVDKETVIVERSEANEVQVEEAKTFEAISESKLHVAEEIHEIDRSPTEGKTFTDEVEEEIKAVPEGKIQPNYQGVEAIIHGDNIPNQTPPMDRKEQPQEPSSALLKEQDREAISKGEMINDESTKNDETQLNENAADSFEAGATEKPCLQNEGPRELEVSNFDLTIHEDSQNQAPEQESTTLEEDSTVKPHPTTKELSPGELGKKCEEASDLKFEMSSQVLESVVEIPSAKAPPVLEETEMKSEKLEGGITKVRDDEHHCEQTTEAGEAIMEDTSMEKITEEKEVARISHPMSPHEETVTKSNLESEIIAEHYPGETNETFETIENDIQHEELFEDSGKAGPDTSIEETNTTEDGFGEDPYHISAGEGTTSSIPPDETKDRKNVNKKPTELDLENQVDEINVRDTGTEATALYKEVNFEKMVVKHEEDRTADKSETVLSKDEQQQNRGLAVPPITHAAAEEAPEEKLGENIEDDIIAAPQGPTHNSTETYEENKETASATINSSESLVDNEMLKHKSPETEAQELCVEKKNILLCTSTSQEEAADRENVNTVNEKQLDFESDEQTAAAASILEEGKRIQSEEHIKDDEPVELSTFGDESKLVEAEIHSATTSNEDEESQHQYEKPSVLSDCKDMEVPAERSITDLAEINEITKDTQELEKTSFPISHEQIAREADPRESIETTNADASTYVPLMQEGPIAKSIQQAEVKELKSANASGTEPGPEGVESGEEKKLGEECQEATEKSIVMDSAKISISELMDTSTRETLQVAEHLTEEKEVTSNKEEVQIETAETAQVEEAKRREEKDEEGEGDEHYRADSGSSDAPVMVEALKDTDVKSAHKKSYNILSGVGSKVKHSIAKVKKVITGKSSHPKTSSPK